MRIVRDLNELCFDCLDLLKLEILIKYKLLFKIDTNFLKKSKYKK